MFDVFGRLVAKDQRGGYLCAMVFYGGKAETQCLAFFEVFQPFLVPFMTCNALAYIVRFADVNEFSY